MAELPRTHARYREAHRHGSQGHQLPRGLADLADNDPAIDEAYQAGQLGEPFETFSGTGSGGAPASPAPARGPRPSTRPRTGTGRSKTNVLRSPARATRSFVTGSVSGVILGAIGYALLLSVVDYGTSGPLYWFQAKFLNEVNQAVAKRAR